MSRITRQRAPRMELPDGGSCSRIIDLASEVYGPPAPEAFEIAPGLFGVRGLPVLPMVRMDTDDMADDSRPLITDGVPFWPEADDAVFTGRLCDDCEPRVHVLTGTDQIGLVAEHARTCPAWRSLLARAGLKA
jgi:hypothetical protein